MPSDDVNMILGGFQSAARGLQPAVDAQVQDQQRNRPLSPFEKWLGKAVAGQLPVEQAAMNAKLEMAGHTIPDDMPMPQQQPGVAAPLGGLSANPQGVANMAAQTPPAPEQGLGGNRIQQVSGPISGLEWNRARGVAGSEWQRPGAGAGGQGGPPSPMGQSSMPASGGLEDTQGPQNAGDMQALSQFQGMMKPRGKTPDDLYMEMIKEQGRNNRNTQNVGGRQNIAEAGMAQRTEQFNATLQYKMQALDQHWNEVLAKLNAYRSIASGKNGTSERIAAARIAVAQEAAKLKSISATFMTDAYLTQNPEVVGFAQKMQADIESRSAMIEQVLNEKMQHGGIVPRETTSATSKQPVHSPSSLNSMFGK